MKKYALIILIFMCVAIAYAAITTEDERRSIGRVPVVPNGVMDLEDRLSIGWLPITITPGEPVEVDDDEAGRLDKRKRYTDTYR